MHCADIIRTRGAGSRPKGQKSPTTSVRRGDRGTSSSAPLVGGDVPPIGGEVPRISGGDAGEVVGFPGDI